MPRHRKHESEAYQAEKANASLAPTLRDWHDGIFRSQRDAWLFFHHYVLSQCLAAFYACITIEQVITRMVDTWAKPPAKKDPGGSIWRHHTNHRSRDVFYEWAKKHAENIYEARYFFRIERTPTMGLGVFVVEPLNPEHLHWPFVTLSGFLTEVPVRRGHVWLGTPSVVGDIHKKGKHKHAEKMKKVYGNMLGDKYSDELEKSLHVLTGLLSLVNHTCEVKGVSLLTVGGQARGRPTEAERKEGKDAYIGPLAKDGYYVTIASFDATKGELATYIIRNRQLFISYQSKPDDCQCPECQ